MQIQIISTAAQRLGFFDTKQRRWMGSLHAEGSFFLSRTPTTSQRTTESTIDTNHFASLAT